MSRKEKEVRIPSIEEVAAERKRIRKGVYYRKALGGTISVLVVVAAVAVLIATLFLPILQISGDSMSPSLENDEIVVMIKTGNINRSDLLGFYYQGKILLKRVIALPGETVAIDSKGNVYIDGELLIEEYVTEKMLGECDLEFPYIVPQGSYFVLCDNRSSSIDSRNSVIGCVTDENIIGKAFFRVWPFNRMGIPE